VDLGMKERMRTSLKANVKSRSVPKKNSEQEFKISDKVCD
jgi:hypothetical protein